MNIYTRLLTIILLFVFSSGVFAEGHLVIIGGGEKLAEIKKKIVELGGGDKARVVIFPNASSYPFESGDRHRQQFELFGPASVDVIYVTGDTLNRKDIVDLVKNATVVFFGGGDQVKLTKELNGTKAYEAVWEVYKRGGVVSGTSAGAAVMSKVMITGDELINKDSTRIFWQILKGNVETKEGFGFLPEVIIDQHFVVRKRHNRLISLMLESKVKTGIAIDESTALIVAPGRKYEVLGESLILVYDARNVKNISTDKNGNLSGQGMKLDIYKSGDKFRLSK